MNKTINNLTEKYYVNMKIKTYDIMKKFIQINYLIETTPLQIKIANIVIFFTITYVSTFIYLNNFISILFAIITIFFISILSKLLSIIFLILYIIILIRINYKSKKLIGNPIKDTDIIKSGKPYYCSNNSLVINNEQLPQGLNGTYFTYSYWIYIDNNINSSVRWSNFRYNEWKSIFYRGSTFNNNEDLKSLVQFPGFWLTPVINNLVVMFSDGSENEERFEINNIPFNTWINFTFVIESTSVSTYINSKLDSIVNLKQNIKLMNSYNLYITNDISINNNESGFAGYLAELIYYNYALNSEEVINSYIYYKKIIDNYQSKINNNNNNYKIPKLITN